MELTEKEAALMKNLVSDERIIKGFIDGLRNLKPRLRERKLMEQGKGNKSEAGARRAA
ncbi:hypothetical protein HYU15_01495 [Candidatus Woesearchaeota archaeon]|nr:hypothetical protein [Candidatus Woesearchaeota archaeon]